MGGKDDDEDEGRKINQNKANYKIHKKKKKKYYLPPSFPLLPPKVTPLTACSRPSRRQLKPAPPMRRMKITATSERLAVTVFFLPHALSPADIHFLRSLSIRPDSRIFCRLKMKG